MLKEKFLPGKGFLFFLITIVSIIFFTVIITTFSEYIMFLKYNLTDRQLKILWTLNLYWILIGMIFYFIFFLLFLNEFFYRYYNLSFRVFLLMSVIISLICCFIMWEANIKSMHEVKIIDAICIIISGIAYPFISNFWARKIQFIKMVPAEEA